MHIPFLPNKPLPDLRGTFGPRYALRGGIFTPELNKNAVKAENRRIRYFSLFFSIAVSLMLVIGPSFDAQNNFGLVLGTPLRFVRSLLQAAGFTFLFFCLFKMVFRFLLEKPLGYKPEKNRFLKIILGSGKKSIWIAWGAIFLCWLPCYLAYYPGILSYDINSQAHQAAGYIPINQFHSTVHTFILTLFFRLGFYFNSHELALVAYSLFQMLALSLALAVVVWYMARLRVHSALRMIVLVYFALNPFCALFSFIPTKDVLFTAFFVPSTIMIVDMVRHPERFFHSLKKQLILVGLLIVLCLFRNNAVYALVLFVPFWLYACRAHLKSVLRISLLFLLLFGLISGPLFILLGVEGGNAREAFSLPVQQIANVVAFHEDELSEKDKETIAELLDYNAVKYDYNPRFADPVKDTFNSENFSADPARYAGLWLRLFARYPVAYTEAFLSLNLGYWYTGCEANDKFSFRYYIETYIRRLDFFPIERKSVFPGLLKGYEAFASGLMMEKVPVVSLLFSIGFPVWVLFFGIIVCFLKRNKRMILAFLPGLFMWLTFMAGPVSNVRYILCVIAAYPVYLALILQMETVRGIDRINDQTEKETLI